ncbi:MAG: MmcQ/YjbR family DNA-binding protein [Notoacmeibacter sp.]|nr:MmcQ/YjbR family DNA-binding protein [Notoacmeibacter sp.]MCC0031917.1 MmcQ/YjbR family DNA-binding protein [Brucellaceae bacterium]
MATANDLRTLALSLQGTVEAPHFDRSAFRVKRIYATLPPDGLTANLKLAPDEQQMQCLMAPHALAPVPNKFGLQGWTTVTLAALSRDELGHVLTMAWHHALPVQKTRKT